MRRLALFSLVGCLLLSACDDGGHAKPAPAPTMPGGGTRLPTHYADFAFPTVSSNEVGIEPKITSTTLPPTETMLKVLHEGTGPAVKAGDVLAADVKGQPWEPSGAQIPPFLNSFDDGTLFLQRIDDIGIAGLAAKLPGVKVGSRVLLVVPPKDAYGIHAPKNSGIQPNDTLMMVIDVLGRFDRDSGPSGTTVTPSDSSLPTVTGTTDPKITIPAGAAPTALKQQLLVRGSGSEVRSGQWLAVQYTGMIWGSGKVFDSTWHRTGGALPNAVRMALPGQLNGHLVGGGVPGFIKGLVGRTVGSRVLLVIPPDQGYGEHGNPTAGISGTDTMVFVVDILGAYRSGEAPTASPTPTPTS